MPWLSRRLGYALTLASCSCLGLACGESRPPAMPAGSAASNGASALGSSGLPIASKEATEATEATSSIHIANEIRSKCGIPDADAYFTFNSAAITTRDRTPLDLVVRCFTSGPLRGRAVRLVGHADPRGASDYNMTLGQWRADAVGGYLTTHGMSERHSETTSRGAMDATGSDEATWQHDRRVDVLLAD